jgi:hypothetical protein
MRNPTLRIAIVLLSALMPNESRTEQDLKQCEESKTTSVTEEITDCGASEPFGLRMTCRMDDFVTASWAALSLEDR